MRYIRFHIYFIYFICINIIISFQLEIIYNSNFKTYDRFNIVNYYGITQDPITKDFMIIMNYYQSGDLTHYITNEFFNINWKDKLRHLCEIAYGLWKIHRKNIIHRDFHSGNILLESHHDAKIGDFGLSKSATESSNDDNEIYGIIPYVAPEIFQGQK